MACLLGCGFKRTHRSPITSLEVQGVKYMPDSAHCSLAYPFKAPLYAFFKGARAECFLRPSITVPKTMEHRCYVIIIY